MSAGNIRMSNVNMNKYDAAQSWNAGTSSKMSLDHQQTASNQSSAKTGTENITSNIDQTIHEGSTWIQGPNGQQYELNGSFKQTAAGWEASGTFIDKDGKSWSGTMTGTAKNMDAFQNNMKNGDEAVLQAMSIDTKNLSKNENINERDSYKGGKEYINNIVSDTRDVTKSGSETLTGHKKTDDNSTNIIAGTKTALGDTTNDYTGGLAMLQSGLSNFKGELMQEAFKQNMTQYQDSILQKAGNDQISEQQALLASGKFEAGVKMFGNGVSFNAAVKASVDHSSGQVDTANLNRLMNEQIMKSLDADAKTNNWTAEQYDQAARERFGAYNDFLRNELGGQVYGPGNAYSEVLDTVVYAGNKAVNAGGKAVDKVNEIIDEAGEKHLDRIVK